MEKLSIYELLSYILPGFLVVLIFDLYHHTIFGENYLLESESIGESLVIFFISLFLGIMIHVLTFKIFMPKKWYQSLMYRDVSLIVESHDELKKIVPFLNQEYKILREHEELPAEEGQIEKNLFDFAYYYLETNDKIGPSKSFQSIYFCFRNVFTIGLFLLPISLFIAIFTLFYCFPQDVICISWTISGVNLLILVLIVPTASWLRVKMVERILRSYYSERIHGKQIK